MARRVLDSTQYTFNPATRTIVIPAVYQRERILLITNVTTNQVIYNFSDSTLKFTSHAITQNTNINNAVTTVVLAYNTGSMNASDKLQIVVDEIAEFFEPEETMIDPVGKLRVSAPQSLIDTDFEFGLQPTKWETLTLINNRPSLYVDTQSPLVITDIQATNGSALITVYTTSPPNVGTPVLIQDSAFPGCNGPFVAEVVSSGVYFQFTCRFPYTGTTGSIYNSTLSAAYTGAFYTGAAYTLASQPTYSGQVVTVTTSGAHGLAVGDGIYIVGATASTNAPNGSFQVSSIPTTTTFEVVVPLTPTGTIASAVVYPRPDGVYIHRAFDGGVQFTTSNSAHNLQTIRQTRRYFRYQSGKGIQISTGTALKPNFNVDEITNGGSGTIITVTTKLPHQMSPGVTVTVSGCNETAYNGSFAVATVLSATKFTYIAGGTPSATVASGLPNLSVTNWYGAGTRIGMFDFQNGFYFEYDGQNLYAVRRKSTDQIAGYVTATANSPTISGATVNGITTKFSKQLIPGDWIVIRGISYRVLDITSDTSMTVTPPYRGATLTSPNVAIVSKTTEIRVPQSQFNMDKVDGTGPSGLNLDLSRMQMFYIDYSWYGAGAVRYGFRDTQGRIVYCHRFVNNNLNTEAYMRSGNLPARYETHTFTPICLLTSSIVNSGDATVNVSDTSMFPSAGTLLIADPNASQGQEYVYYTGKTSTTFTGLTRGKTSTTIASCSTVSGSAAVTTSSSVTGIQPGMQVYGSGIPTNTYVYSITVGSPNTITLSQAASATGSVTLSFNRLGAVAAGHTYSATAPIPLYLHAPLFSPTISHWGTSVIMDGRFDDDKSLIFTYGETATATVASGGTTALMSIRVAPSVDSGITSFLGQKEVVNRMQLKLVSLGALVSGSFLVTAVLNARLSSGGGTLGTFGPVATGTSSLSQLADHTGAITVTGGEVVYGQFAVNSAGSTNLSTETIDLTQIRDLGNSIMGGGLNNNVTSGIYPDGPDVITFVARNIGAASATIQGRLSWTEAQA